MALWLKINLQHPRSQARLTFNQESVGLKKKPTQTLNKIKSAGAGGGLLGCNKWWKDASAKKRGCRYLFISLVFLRGRGSICFLKEKKKRQKGKERLGQVSEGWIRPRQETAGGGGFRNVLGFYNFPRVAS